MREFQIDKVKFKEGRTTIRYTEPVSGDEYEINSIDPAKPEFIQALQLLLEDVLDMCELEDTEWLDKYFVSGCSFSHGERVGVTITALKSLENSHAPLVLNTPHKFFSGDDPKSILTDACIKRLNNLAMRANEYISGERAQGNLFNFPDKSAVGK